MPESTFGVTGSPAVRIALFVPSLFPGGVERMMLNLARGFLSRGYSIDFVAANATGAFREEVPNEARLIDLKARRVLTAIPALADYLRRERPHTLIAGMTHSTIAAICARKLAGAGTTIIGTEHVDMSSILRGSHRLRERSMPLLARWLLPRADLIVAVSKGVAEGLSRQVEVPRERIRGIYNPVITPAIFLKSRESPSHPWFSEMQSEASASEKPVILSVGQLTRPKDQETLLRAFAALLRIRPARLLILGEGPLRSNLEKLAAELGISEHLSMPGFEPNPYAYMARAKVFALSSVTEGFGMVLVEALALGAQVVATDCPGGPREILGGGRWGTLVPMGDVEKFCEALVSALDAPRRPVPAEALKDYELDFVTTQYERLLGLANASPRL